MVQSISLNDAYKNSCLIKIIAWKYIVHLRLFNIDGGVSADWFSLLLYSIALDTLAFTPQNKI